MIEPGPEANVDNAMAYLQQALGQWSGGDPSHLEVSHALVECTVTEILAAHKAITEGYAEVPGDIRQKLVSLKTMVAQATRLVDSGAAFYGGMIAQLGKVIQMYNGEGHVRPGLHLPAQYEVIG